MPQVLAGRSVSGPETCHTARLFPPLPEDRVVSSNGRHASPSASEQIEPKRRGLAAKPVGIVSPVILESCGYGLGDHKSRKGSDAAARGTFGQSRPRSHPRATSRLGEIEWAQWPSG